MAEVTLQIDGMHCGACVRRVSQALGAIPGVVVKEVRVGAARIETTQPAAGGETSPEAQAVEAVAKAGYVAHSDAVIDGAETRP